MLKSFLALFLFATSSAAAQNWSVGAATGPFGFGRFAERTIQAAAGDQTEKSTLYLSAATRPGVALDVERRLGRRWAIRLEASGTEAPVNVKDDSDSGVSLDAGKIDIATLMIPLVFTINPNGAIRIQILAGPAHAVYHIRRRTGSGSLALFEGTRARWGGAGAVGASWWLSPRFAVEGGATDIVTASPFRRSDFPASATGLRIPKTHNVHVTAGMRWAF